MTTPVDLREKARNCRELAMVADDATAVSLRMLAQDYEAQAQQLEGDPAPPSNATPS